MKEGQACVRGGTGARRGVYVNGVWCESMAAAARKASVILKREIKAWKIQKLLDGRQSIPGLTVSGKPPERKTAPVKERREIRQLIRYPLGEEPWNKGIPGRWV